MAKRKIKTKHPQKHRANKSKIHRKPKAKVFVVNVKKLFGIEEAVKYLLDLSGDKGIEVFKYLITHGEMEENLLAKRMKFNRANAIRKYLYKLYNKNLVSYIRVRKGSKAWYTYYWKANPERLVFLLKGIYEEEIKQAKKSIELNKTADFYVCEVCNRRYSLNEALENDFRCSNCGGNLQHLENALFISDKENRIKFLNKKIANLDKLVREK
ncbi:hypothetical protein M1139_01200 [Candidatus Parvarchaeota archaeon]|nr:hypothetical protein [Candidatus Parvarchaeota archaeon]